MTRRVNEWTLTLRNVGEFTALFVWLEDQRAGNLIVDGGAA
ncbi:MAG TPA: hypothetical protein VFD70_21545 [Anaerolineae bacterium]|nr:hypothetical protein [Anaerolineae bacterium]